MEKIPCSVLILTRNSAGTLERCLKNLGAFAEIVVHDANSEDDSASIARRFGAKVFKQYDTEEKSVRVKDFTEMRLAQRAAASFDWVLYLDSDEYLSDEAVREIGEILKTASPKIVVKIPRVPVIDGVPRTRGDIFKEVMPRLHHRRGGVTFKKDKAVHEKYEYDSSFTEISMKSPLYVPLPGVEDLRPKDDRYLTLEIERMRRDGYSWPLYVRWVLFREPLIMLQLLWKILLTFPSLGHPESMPPAHNFRYVRYHWRLFRAITSFMVEKSFRS